MATSILSIGQSALAAAQVGINTTGHNIANAATPGYNRQIVVQGAAQAQNFGFGFLGQGVDVSSVTRVYNEFLGNQVQTAQTTKSGLDSYYAQIRQIDNLLADPTTGLSTAMQEFFAGLQDVSTSPTSIPARQSALSTAESLATRFQSLSGRLEEIERSLNGQIQSSVSDINTLGSQIALLNDAIGKAERASGQPPNDLLDQRDQLLLELNKQIKVTVVEQGSEYNVFIGNGQPLVVGTTSSMLVNVASPTNPEKIEVAFRASNGNLVPLAQSALSGGELGGLLDFRTQSLEQAQNALGRVAIGLAATFNAQHQSGYGLDGSTGNAFFTAGAPVVGEHGSNTGNAVIGAAISSPTALTTSDYRLQYDGTNYTVTRLSDNTATTFASFPQTVDGVTLSLASGAAAAGDSFLIRPTVNGASGFGVAITDPAKLAAAGVAGAVGDNSNALLLAGLQTSRILGNSTLTYQDAYSQLVSQVGNKTRELDVTSSAAAKMLTEATLTLQNESGVNLDEEAANLLRYQQAYQAAGKVMQIASELFDVLLSIGR
ncbi:flagellar hook-associated protein FlgK [Thiobacillus sp.]|uniref:flagellar hook-associated protein FlgK n=1 Tax=Thiobacillus sp. TaxID=924 RepID=UPI0025D026F0|nr:flagellar hook-associated protein FlgK [Thiobacillus sp.]MBT9540520.1 flagellar hook-associated protein FlgK [Thiobacillus sp.]